MKISKEILDYTLAFCGLVVLIIPLFLLFILTSLDTGRNGFFSQERIGKNGKSFYLYKLRTMKGVYASSVTTNKMHITTLGKFLRNYKLDELPQIFNLLKGEMSLVGPRPDVPGYADKLEGEDRIILSVKPGITGPAQLKYKNEEKILSEVEDPQRYNDEVIWKDKVEINKEYVKNQSLLKDLKYLIRTVFS
ncbi:MAG: sugar transferase [Flavobacteriaceae bacterium]|jgi:lipopolysaccharide/colanic/teichoic acid biosynthesis glycosyltransferase|nr:sugar transferase [Flavobacteriaceae bacterium]